MKNRIKENKENQSNRIYKAYQKDIDQYCTFKPEINATSREIVKNSDDQKEVEKEYDFIKEFINQNKSLLKTYKDLNGNPYPNISFKNKNSNSNSIYNNDIKNKSSKSRDRESNTILSKEGNSNINKLDNQYLHEIQTFGFKEKNLSTYNDFLEDENIYIRKSKLLDEFSLS